MRKRDEHAGALRACHALPVKPQEPERPFKRTRNDAGPRSVALVGPRHPMLLKFNAVRSSIAYKISVLQSLE